MTEHDAASVHDTFPDVYPRLAYRDEHAAVDYLTGVFGFEEEAHTRLEHGGRLLACLRTGNGIVMVGHENADVRRIFSPAGGRGSAQIMVHVHDIDHHYARAAAAGGDVTLALQDAPFGDRRYEATEPEGQRWAFHESLAEVRARGGAPLDAGTPRA